MALKVQASFSAGEIDPALHERTTLQKYDSGLATGRNVAVGKTGRLISRPGRKHFTTTRSGNRAVIWPMSNVGTFLEFTDSWVRVFVPNDPDPMIEEHSTSYTEDDLDLLHFVDGPSGFVYIFCAGKATELFFGGPGGGFMPLASTFYAPAAPTLLGGGAVTFAGTGYDVEYVFTKIMSGQESLVSGTLSTAGSGNGLPINAGEINTLTVSVGTTSMTSLITEMRVYRRPAGGGAFGYIGSSSSFSTSGTDRRCTFKDVGQAADYTNTPPAISIGIQSRGSSGPTALLSPTGAFYQQRLLMANGAGIEASRPGYPNNFYRDYPLSADSALTFRNANAATILRMIESDGLVAFTTDGPYLHTGVLSTTNLGLERKGSWIIDYRVPPIAIPGGVLFVDSSSNTIRRLMWSQEKGSYLGQELSIFSDHLFVGKTIKSWAFESGQMPMLWVVFSDGTFAGFTYEEDHEMRAWTRHDSNTAINVVYVAATTRGTDQINLVPVEGQTIWVVEKDGTHYIELGVPRYAFAEDLVDDPETPMKETIAYMDSMVSWSRLLNDELTGSNDFTLTPSDPDDLEAEMELSCGTQGLFTAGTLGAVGTTFRHFNPDDGSTVDLVVTARTSNNVVTVQPSAEFPEDYLTSPRLYQAKQTFTGLDHMEGEDVAVIVDGYVFCSPNNDEMDYPELTVSGGSITLPDEYLGAIVHIGRPIVGDIETLDIATVEQRPVANESRTVNKVYVKVHRSRGLYVGNTFPDDDLVTDMQEIGSIDANESEDQEILANRYDAPQTKKVEVTLPGDWDSNGRVCLRQVDPVHFEILSITPDLEDLRR